MIRRPVEPPPSRWVLPDPRDAAGDLVAVGGDLAPGTVLAAYRAGLFPMRLGLGGPLGWWSPDPRAVLPLHALRVSRSLRASTRRFTIRVDQAFEAVVRGCAEPGRPERWIDDSFVDSYVGLHELGWAHSVEAWAPGADGRPELAGGLFGVAVGGLFAGESMFHHRRDASKVALVALVDRLRDAGADLLDVQWSTPHLRSLGVVEISRAEYLERLAAAVGGPVGAAFAT